MADKPPVIALPTKNPDGSYNVIGHWRRTPDGKRVWIAPYVRGPEKKSA